jgi:putative transposase
MARQPRIDLAGYTYHVINRASGRVPIFRAQRDYIQFEEVLKEAIERTDMGVAAYCVMPNHFHLALQPKEDGAVQAFMRWLTKTQTQRWHSAHKTIGYGHLYQGRYKSFIVNTDEYYLTLMRYIEQNPLRAKLVQHVEEWKYGSAFRRYHGTLEQCTLLDAWRVPEPKTYRQNLDILQDDYRLQEIRASVSKGIPLGGDAWRSELIDSLGLGYTTRGVGRPKNGS